MFSRSLSDIILPLNIKMEKHSCFIAEVRPTDWFAGVNSNIVFKSNLPTGNWRPYFHYFERQKFVYDSNMCVIAAQQEIVDAQIDWLITTGQVAQPVVDALTALGFMDASGSDGKPHFHSSFAFPGSLTGNGTNGNPLPAPWDIARKYGLLPWTDRPFDANTNINDLLAKPSQAELDKAKQVIQYFSFSYHWIVDNGDLLGTPITKMKTALQQTPLQIGINIGAAWNQKNPTPSADLSPGHSVAVELMDGATEVLDHYDPFEKSLTYLWNIGYVLQGVVTPVLPIPQPVPQLPPNPTNPQISSWLDSVKSWLLKVVQIYFPD